MAIMAQILNSEPKEIPNVYTTELKHLLAMMLTKDRSTRPNTRKLMAEYYVYKCANNLEMLEMIPLIKREDLDPHLALQDFKKIPSMGSANTADKTLSNEETFGREESFESFDRADSGSQVQPLP
jgi:hypothetical protein